MLLRDIGACLPHTEMLFEFLNLEGGVYYFAVSNHLSLATSV